jgi:hypothetical protein
VSRKEFALFMQLHDVHVVLADDVAAPLLDGNVIIAPVEGVQVCASGEAQLKAHLRVAHHVAIL